MKTKKLDARINLRIEKEVRDWLESEAGRNNITDGSEMARKILRDAKDGCGKQPGSSVQKKTKPAA
jgi:hypothetical protein